MKQINKLRNRLYSAGLESEARRITQSLNEYTRACKGQNNAQGGNYGAYLRLQEAVRSGRAALEGTRV